MSKKVYYKLGENAASFTDAITGIDLAPGMVCAADSSAPILSRQVAEALKGGHIVKTDEDDYNEADQKRDYTKKEKKLTIPNKKAVVDEGEDGEGDQSEKDEEVSLEEAKAFLENNGDLLTKKERKLIANDEADEDEIHALYLKYKDKA